MRPGDDDLVAGIDRFGRVACDIGLDRHDLSAGNCHVADGINPNRRIDDASAPDNQVVCCRKRFRSTPQQYWARCGGAHKLASVHHGCTSSALKQGLLSPKTACDFDWWRPGDEHHVADPV